MANKETTKEQAESDCKPLGMGYRAFYTGRSALIYSVWSKPFFLYS